VAHRNGVGPRHRDNAEARKGNALANRIPSSRTSNPKQYSVTDGRTALGTIELIDGSHVAIDATGPTLGTFATLRAAMASFGRPQ
jgi:hypothetical protein